MNFFITGTGTDVGKTYVAAGLAWQMCHQRKKKFYYIKPVATGVIDKNLDVECVKKVLRPFGFANVQGWQTYKEPASPFVAAKAEKAEVPCVDILKKLDSIDKNETDFIVEGAGGVLVPLTDKFLIIDLIAKLNWPVIIVGHYGLGTVNHTCLTIEALKARKCKIAGVILNQTQDIHNEEYVLAAETNQAEITRITGVKVFGIVSFGDKPEGKTFSDIWNKIMAHEPELN